MRFPQSSRRINCDPCGSRGVIQEQKYFKESIHKAFEKRRKKLDPSGQVLLYIVIEYVTTQEIRCICENRGHASRIYALSNDGLDLIMLICDEHIGLQPSP